MCPADNLVRMDEAVRARIIVWQEFDPVQSFALEASLKRSIETEPAYPKNVDGDGRGRDTAHVVLDIAVEDGDDSGVLEWMGVEIGGLWRKRHDISMGARIHRILTATHVVRCVVDAQDLVDKHTIATDEYCAPFLGSKFYVVSREIGMQQS